MPQLLATYNLITLCNQTVLCSVSELIIRIPDPSVITAAIAKGLTPPIH